MSDENTESSSDSTAVEEIDPQEQATDESTQEASGAEQEAEGEEQKKPVSIGKAQYDRVNRERHEAQRTARWYQENVGTPEEVLAYRKWKAEQGKNGGTNGSQDAKQPLSSERREAVRQLIKETNPELYEFQERLERQHKALEEAQFDQAEDHVRSTAKAEGLPKDDEYVQMLGQLALLRIRNDEKLLARWNARDPKVFESSLRHVIEKFVGPTRRLGAGQAAAVKRQVSRLPSAPAGSSTMAGKGKDTGKGMGFSDPTLRDRAWAALQGDQE